MPSLIHALVSLVAASQLSLLADAQLSQTNSWVFPSGKYFTNIWFPADSPWRLQPAYFGTQQIMQLSYKGIRVFGFNMTFDASKTTLNLTLNAAGQFVTSPIPTSETNATELRLSKLGPVAEMWWVNQRQWARLELDTYNPNPSRRWTLNSTMVPNNRIFILDSGVENAFHYGDWTNHGTTVTKLAALGWSWPAYDWGTLNVLADSSGYYNPSNNGGTSADNANEQRAVELLEEITTTNRTIIPWVGASLTWKNQNATGWKCATQWAWQSGIRIVKAAGNSAEECDDINPYVINVGAGDMPTACNVRIDAQETSDSFVSRMTGTSMAAAKMLTYYSRGWMAPTYPMNLTRHGLKDYAIDFCAQLRLPSKDPKSTDWATLKYQWSKLKNGRLLASSTSPNKRPYPGPTKTTF